MDSTTTTTTSGSGSTAGVPPSSPSARSSNTTALHGSPSSTSRTPQFQQQQLELAEQINEEFLTCKICLEPFTEPKSLTCLHTFCATCIDNHVSATRCYKYADYREFACPICRKKTSIPTGGVRKLPDNFLVASLSDLVSRTKPCKQASCEICTTLHQRQRDASAKCLDCNKLLCRHCASTHQQTKITSNHSVFELEIEKDIECRSHESETVRYYCQTCEQCICLLCAFSPEHHRDHDLVEFRDGIARHRESISGCLQSCRDQVDELRHYLSSLRHCDQVIAGVEARIHDAAMSCVAAVRQREQQLIEQLYTIFGVDTKKLIARREELERHLEQLKHLSSLTELVLKGRDIELLLLKKQITEKYSQLGRVDLVPLPENIDRKVSFIPGTMALGELYEGLEEDHASEVAGRKRDARCQTDPVVHWSAVVEAEVQTDIRMIHDLAAPTRSSRPRPDRINVESQTDRESSISNGYRSSSFEDSQPSEPTTPVDVNAPTSLTEPQADVTKFSRRVRRHLKPGSSVAMLPNTDIAILDPEFNIVSILDRRGKFKYALGTAATENGSGDGSFRPPIASFGNMGVSQSEERTVRIPTPQGMLTVRLDYERVGSLPFAITVQAFESLNSLHSPPARPALASARSDALIRQIAEESASSVDDDAPYRVACQEPAAANPFTNNYEY